MPVPLQANYLVDHLAIFLTPQPTSYSILFYAIKMLVCLSEIWLFLLRSTQLKQVPDDRFLRIHPLNSSKYSQMSMGRHLYPDWA